MSGCGATCGIQKHRARERVDALEVIDRARRHELIPAPPPLDRLTAIARRCAHVLPVRAFVRPAGSGDRQSAWVYLLAGLHRPSLLEHVDDLSPHTTPFTSPAISQETYIRLGFSSLGRYVTLQETRFEAELLDDGLFITETPRAGVEDTRLAMIVKGLQGILRAEKLIVLDMAFLLGDTADDSDPEPDSPWFSLFEPLPCHTPSMTFVPTSPAPISLRDLHP